MAVALPSPPAGWRSVENPPSLFRRFEFASYEQTRNLLDRLADLSQETGVYPDLGFSRTHVNITLYPQEGGALGESESRLAIRISALADGIPH